MLISVGEVINIMLLSQQQTYLYTSPPFERSSTTEEREEEAKLHTFLLSPRLAASTTTCTYPRSHRLHHEYNLSRETASQSYRSPIPCTLL